MNRWVLAACLCAACTFPDVEYDDTTGVGAAAAGGASASASTASGSTAQTGAGASDCGPSDWPSACDGDNDDWPNEMCCSDATQRDCDDGDALVKPSQDAFFDMPRDGYDLGDPNAFDYDCSETHEAEYPEGNCINPGTLTCPGTEKRFISPAMDPCGTQVNVFHCGGSSTCAQQGTEILKCH